MQTATEIKPYMKAGGKPIDGVTAVGVELFDRSQHSVLKIVREYLDCTHDNSYTNPDNSREAGYRNSGLWSKHRNEAKSLCINIDVGCSHERDCCGCLCHLSYEISLTANYIVVITSHGYNY